MAWLVPLRDFLSEKLFLAWEGRSQGMKPSPWVFFFTPNCLAEGQGQLSAKSQKPGKSMDVNVYTHMYPLDFLSRVQAWKYTTVRRSCIPPKYGVLISLQRMQLSHPHQDRWCFANIRNATGI